MKLPGQAHGAPEDALPIEARIPVWTRWMYLLVEQCRLTRLWRVWTHSLRGGEWLE